MKIRMQHIQDEQGFVLVAALMIMLVLTILGISTTLNTSTELQIASNDKVHKITFYGAEGGAALGSELLEQNFNCVNSFSDGTIVPTIWAKILTIGSNNVIDPLTLTTKLKDPVNNYDVAYSLTGVTLSNAGVAVALQTQEIGYLYYGGTTSPSPGGALQMASGYEGKGKSSAEGGADRLVNIYSQFRGIVNSESIVLYGWRHVIGSEGSCVY